MKRKTKVKIQKIFQATYLLIFFILEIWIAGDIEQGFETPIYIWVSFIISGLLIVSKMIYHDLKYPGAKYVWH